MSPGGFHPNTLAMWRNACNSDRLQLFGQDRAPQLSVAGLPPGTLPAPSAPARDNLCFSARRGCGCGVKSLASLDFRPT